MVHFKWLVRKKLHRLGLWKFAEQGRLIYRFLTKNPHESDFGVLGVLNLADGPILDIGANIGQSAVSIRIFDKKREIISFEPNPLHEPDLKLVRRWLPNFEFKILGISYSSREWTYSVPTVDAVPLTQEGTFDPEILADRLTADRVETTTGKRHFQISRQSLRCEPLDSVVEDFAIKPSFIKLDVQGHELDVLRGGEKTLREIRPVLMIENGPSMEGCRRFLDARGYSGWYYDADSKKLKETCPEYLNVIFLPREI